MTSRATSLARQVVWSQRRNLALGLALLFVDRAAGFVIPLAPKVLLDEVVGHRRADLLPWLALAVVSAAMVQAAAVFALSRVLGLSAERVVLGWRRRIMAHVTRLPASALAELQAGELASRVMEDAATMQNLVGWELARWTSNVVTALVALVALFLIDWRITLAALAFAALPGFGLDFAHRNMRPLFRERARQRAAVAGRLTQTLSGLRVVKAYGAERREQLVFAKGLHGLFRILSRTTTRSSAMNGLAVVIYAGVIALVVVLGGRAMLEGRLTLGDFGSYVAFALMFAAPLGDLPQIATRVSETLADLDRLQEIEALPREDDDDAARAPLAGRPRTLSFDHVSFGYAEDLPVLHDVTFTAAPGTTTAIVGPSGAGKSTLLSLVMAFHRPTAGRILVDDQDLAGVRLRDYRRCLGVVLQDEYLFDGTIADNIAFARPRATRAEVAEASRVAHLSDVVAALPRGLDTMVGERGVKLSGGQRQRVAIARAVLADAPLLLLDEATSSLDSESEAAIQDALTTLRRGRTVLVVAHRLSTVRGADQILVLDHGRIVERGTHAELMVIAGGRYRRLYETHLRV
ncbi:MAG: Lipid export ATP-binding/permease protein MsbA [Labilithrix sp.]|nr:Lipid export ATP-binding/permease protein MsbA [Labilithrix sp.]